MRSLISYDDIVAPEAAPTPQQTNPLAAPPPAKKRKTNQSPNQHRQGYTGGGRAYQSVQHWDDPGAQEPQMMYDETPAPSTSASAAAGDGRVGGAAHNDEDGEGEDKDDSRELTHDEIWDDSALIDAWNSAAAEYEAFHGPGKKWKEQPAKKSPLWYNVPPATNPTQTAHRAAAHGAHAASTNAHGAGAADTNSVPINFDTYVPTHDPSLAGPRSALAAPAMDGAAALAVGSEAAAVSQDEAFTRAMSAMYWSGYWTAVYHCRRNEVQHTDATAQENGSYDGDEAVDDATEDEEMLPAQR
ncbi:hypothetical protein BC628DRAFT_1505769 [Trametes gibbosa]|nr:hypothetical protein BC628DRAFT_1505769 [Trametes gibbosa]